jgi:hypothetical protein
MQELADADGGGQQQLAAARQRHAEEAAGLMRKLEVQEVAHSDALQRLQRQLDAVQEKLAVVQVQNARQISVHSGRCRLKRFAIFSIWTGER